MIVDDICIQLYIYVAPNDAKEKESFKRANAPVFLSCNNP